MSDGYTIENLRALEDIAPLRGFAATQEARFARQALAARDTGLALHRVKPGKRQAFGHRHQQAEEIYVVVSGSGRVKLDDEIVEIGLLDAIRVAPAVVRAFEGGPEGIELLAFGPHHEGDGEIFRDFWVAD
jgi:mannose-6-phosphate isomerase-like protein (cupin superfamily)